MAGLSLTKGAIVEFHGRRYTCGGRGPGGAYLLVPHTGRSNRSIKPEAAFDELAKGNLKIVQDTPDYEGEPMPDANFNITSLPEKERDNLLMRHFFMQKCLKFLDEGGKLSNAALSDFTRRTHSTYVGECRKKGRPVPASTMSASAVRRWFKKWTDSGFKLISLVHDAKGNSHSKLTPEQEDFLYTAIHDDYMNQQRKTARQVYDLMEAKINVENRARATQGKAPILTPHYNTFLAHLERIDLYDKLKARFNAAYALKVTRHYGITPPINRHLERVQIDHTLVDLYVDFGEKILVRPWLTLVMDSFSKAILGYWLTPSPASSESVMQALRMAVMPKNLHELGGDPKNWYWPMHGLPSELTLDNGKEFHGKDLEMAAAELGITLNFTPPRQPWFKSQVERMFGQINRSLLTQLPGQVFKYEPENHGMDYPHLTLEEFKRIFLQWITTVLHRHPNKDGYTPEELWTESVQKHGIPGSGLSYEYIDMCLSKAGGKKIVHSNGIHLHNLTFNNEWLSRLRNELAPKVGDGKPKVTVKWAANDVGKIWVLHPDIHQFFPVLSKEEYAHGRSLFSHKVVLREKLNRRKAKMQDATYADAVLAINQGIKALTEIRVAKGKKLGAKIARFVDGNPQKTKPRTEILRSPEPFDPHEPIQQFGEDLMDISTGKVPNQKPHASDSNNSTSCPLGDEVVILDDLEV